LADLKAGIEHGDLILGQGLGGLAYDGV
jgi:hypothetical protein